MENKKVVFILGRLNVRTYWKPYEKAEDDLSAAGFIPLSPSRLPYNLPQEKRMELQLAMLNAADAVLLIPGWHLSTKAQTLLAYAKAINKPLVKLANAEGGVEQ